MATRRSFVEIDGALLAGAALRSRLLKQSMGFVLLFALPASAEESKCRSWYQQPAGRWVEALPLGNGRLGAVVFGGVAKERLQLNEESLWAGEPVDTYPDDFADNLRVLQRLVLEGKIEEARQFGLEKLTKSPTSFRSYEVKGLRARGGFVVDIEWKDGRITKALIHSKVGGPCKVRYDDKLIELDTKPGEDYDLEMN
jgi:hypothetical protein